MRVGTNLSLTAAAFRIVMEERSSSGSPFLEGAFLEHCANGDSLPPLVFSPITANITEERVLQEAKTKYGLTHRQYLLNGFVAYTGWLKDRLALEGLGNDWEPFVLHCVLMVLPQSIQCDDPQKTTVKDLFTSIGRADTDALEKISVGLWRGTAGVLGARENTDCPDGTFVISLTDLESGTQKPPPCGFHLGLRMLQHCGYGNFDDVSSPHPVSQESEVQSPSPIHIKVCSPAPPPT